MPKTKDTAQVDKLEVVISRIVLVIAEILEYCFVFPFSAHCFLQQAKTVLVRSCVIRRG